MAKSREKWRLPKAFKPAKVKKGCIQRSDGEPRFYRLTKHDNDKTLTTHCFNMCCDCGLTHHLTFNVLKAGKKWYLVERAYREPGTGKEK
ncbi:hypothetical protein LCGC14_1659440 [marine sediment metagenome]|uniref:Uncharacterized protein n=1 Tax=marine sediment metagenome TaxID=412755 RepID=A0A0F9KUT4_9ZZZZ